MKQSDSREKLFDSSLKTVNISVNTELSMSCSFNSKKEVNNYFHFYGDGDDDVFHKVISVDNLAYSTSYNDEDDDNGERHAGLKPCETGLETCDVLKPTRHGNEPLGKCIQSVVLLHCGCLSLNPFIEFSIRNNSSSSDVLNIQASISISPKFESQIKDNKSLSVTVA